MTEEEINKGNNEFRKQYIRAQRQTIKELREENAKLQSEISQLKIKLEIAELEKETASYQTNWGILSQEDKRTYRIIFNKISELKKQLC